ncbi:MAG: protein kinase [Verrucomicrobiales bacterium]|nr:protein kinase [Verrucomicrobiales bacterium]
MNPLMTGSCCSACGRILRQEVAAGLCPRCLMLRALQTVPESPSDPTPSHLNEPRRIGPYEILDEIARGGMGIVFRARERGTGRVVALKLLRGAEWATGDFLERFRTEARAAAGLVHPNIVPVYAFGEDGGNWYIAMRLIEGGSLADWIRRHVPGAAAAPGDPAHDRAPGTAKGHRAAAGIIRKVAEATHHAHQHGVLHRDLKPENVLLDAAGEPFLTDFGLARLADSEGRLTRTQTSLGTPAYSAPEVARGGSSEATVLSDVYGLGAMFYELLTGRPPFEGATPLEILRRVADTEVRRPSAFFQKVDRDLETICLKAISRRPQDRYASCAALAGELGRWLAGQPIEARPVGTLERTVKWVRRRPVLAGLAALLAVSLLVITVGSWLVSRNLRAIGEQQRRSLVALNVDTANRLISQKDPAASLPYQIDSIRLDSADPARAAMHRIRLGLTLEDLPQLSPLWAHAGPANSATFSRDGRIVLSASDDGTARIGTIEGVGPERILKHPEPVIQALFSPDDRLVLTLCRDRRARCWDVGSGTEKFAAWPIRLHYYKLPLSPAASFSPDGSRILSGVGNQVELRDSETGSLLFPPHHTEDLVDLTGFSPDGQRIFCGLANGLVEVFRLSEEGLQLEGSHRHVGGVTAAGFSISGATVASVGLDARGILWDAGTGSTLGVPFGHETSQRITQAAFSPVEERFATLSFDNSVRVWDGTTGRLLTWGIGHPNGVTLARWDASGKRIVTGSFDGTAQVWDAGTGRLSQPLLRHGCYVLDACFSPSGRELVTAANDGGIRLWTLEHSRKVSPPRQGGAVQWSFFNREGSQLARVTGGGAVFIEGLLPDASTHSTRLQHTHGVRMGCFDPTGKFIATATEDGAVHLWEAASGRETAQPQTVKGEVTFLGFDAEGARLVTTSSIGFSAWSHLHVWSTPTLTRLAQMVEDNERIQRAEFSPDGRQILTTSHDSAIRLRDSATGLGTRTFVPGRHMVDEAHYSPDGRWFVTAEYDPSFASRPAQLWSVATGKPVGAPLSHQDGTVSCAFSPDGRRVASGSEDGTARIWKVPSGEPVTPPLLHENKVRQVLFSADGTLLATRTHSGAVRLWDASTGSPLMESFTLPGGPVSISFLKATSEFLAVGSDGVLHRWDCTPVRGSLEALGQWTDRFSGTPPGRWRTSVSGRTR